MSDGFKIQNPKSKIINPPALAQPRGFSHGVMTQGGRLLFLAGQTASDARGGSWRRAIWWRSMSRCCSNLQAVVTAAGGTMPDIVQITMFVRDRDDLYRPAQAAGAGAYGASSARYYPAMALFEMLAPLSTMTR